MTENKGYLFPIPVDPGELACFKVYIPKDNLYLAAFWSSFQYLATWHAWARDDDHNAKDVAAVWMEAFQKSRDEYIEGGGCLPQFRLNDDCLLEVNCGTDDDPDWKSVFTSPHPGQEPQIPYPPDTPEYEDDTARCIAAANITAALKLGTETLANDAAIVGGIGIAIINLLGTFLFFVPGGILVDIAIAIIDLAVGHVASDFSDDLPAIDWDDVRNNIACLIERDGSVTDGDRLAIVDWMSTVYVGNLAWGLSTIIIQNVTGDGLTNDARTPQNDIDTTGCDICGAWSHTFDFTIDQQGWTISQNPSGGAYPCLTGYEGAYDSGVGFQPILDPTVSSSSDTRWRVCPIITFSERPLTSIDFGFGGTATQISIFTDPCNYTGQSIFAVTAPVSFDITDTPYTSLMIMFCMNGDTERLTSITLHGLGTDPF